MSQDNQNEPQGNQPQPSQKPYQTAQPIWKSTIIQFLKGTIGVLETTVEKLETEPLPGTQETSWWSKFLGKIRSLLPANLSAKFSDTALTGIIAAITVLFIWLGFSVFTGKPTEVATVPPAEEKIPPPAQEKPAQEKPAQEKPAEGKPAQEKPVPPTAEEVPSETIITPPELTAPEPPQPVEIVPLEPTPTPTPTPTPILLTPEQTLIAAIENQVAEVSDRFASGLIKSIQANFRTSNLKIVISDDWYTLPESQQNKLAAEMLQRSQQLDFAHVEITDLKDRLVARSPVVGTEMVIFQRRA